MVRKSGIHAGFAIKHDTIVFNGITLCTYSFTKPPELDRCSIKGLV
jgi:hypothetical protein